MPPTSRSPKRKRVRRYFSASAATGLRYSSKLAEYYASTSTTGTSHRPELSSSSTDNFAVLRERNGNISLDDEDGSSPSRDYESVLSQPERHSFEFEVRPPLTYSSLPPTPITSSTPQLPSPPPTAPSFTKTSPPVKDHEPPFSLLDYLREELLATDFDSHQELKWERVGNFLHMPLAMEKVGVLRLTFCYRAYGYTHRSLALGLSCA